MKKSIKVLIIVGIILAIIIGIVFIAIHNLNKEKIPATADKFKATMEAKEFKVIDVTSQFAQYSDYMNKAYVAQKDGYQIEFFVLSNVENATNMYDINKKKFESQKGNSSAFYTTNMKNYSLYSITTNGKYKYISRIDNTLVYVDADANYQKEIKTILKTLGY